MTMDDKELLEDNEHFGRVFHHLREMQKSTMLCDGEVEAQGQHVKVHRILLVAASSYFNDKFTEFPQSCERLHIPDITAEGLISALVFIYTGRLSLTGANIHEVNQACTVLQLEKAVGLCQRYIDVHKLETSFAHSNEAENYVPSLISETDVTNDKPKSYLSSSQSENADHTTSWATANTQDIASSSSSSTNVQTNNPTYISSSSSDVQQTLPTYITNNIDSTDIPDAQNNIPTYITNNLHSTDIADAQNNIPTYIAGINTNSSPTAPLTNSVPMINGNRTETYPDIYPYVSQLPPFFTMQSYLFQQPLEQLQRAYQYSHIPPDISTPLPDFTKSFMTHKGTIRKVPAVKHTHNKSIVDSDSVSIVGGILNIIINKSVDIVCSKLTNQSKTIDYNDGASEIKENVPFQNMLTNSSISKHASDKHNHSHKVYRLDIPKPKPTASIVTNRNKRVKHPSGNDQPLNLSTGTGTPPQNVPKGHELSKAFSNHPFHRYDAQLPQHIMPVNTIHDDVVGSYHKHQFVALDRQITGYHTTDIVSNINQQTQAVNKRQFTGVDKQLTEYTNNTTVAERSKSFHKRQFAVGRSPKKRQVDLGRSPTKRALMNITRSPKKRDSPTKKSRVCPRCLAGFPTNTAMRRHWIHCRESTLTNDAIATMSCHRCVKEFRSVVEYKAHMLTTHQSSPNKNDQKPHACNVCGSRFKSNKLLHSHQFTAHKIPIDQKLYQIYNCQEVETISKERPSVL